MVASLTRQGAPPFPPPWLLNMQRYGPPPSYPNLKIPGLNAPIPPVRHALRLGDALPSLSPSLCLSLCL
jgi:hypothetical protein